MPPSVPALTEAETAGVWRLKTGENVAQRIDCQQVWLAGGKRRILVLCAVVWDDVVINGGVAVLRVVLN